MPYSSARSQVASSDCLPATPLRAVVCAGPHPNSGRGDRWAPTDIVLAGRGSARAPRCAPRHGGCEAVAARCTSARRRPRLQTCLSALVRGRIESIPTTPLTLPAHQRGRERRATLTAARRATPGVSVLDRSLSPPAGATEGCKMRSGPPERRKRALTVKLLLGASTTWALGRPWADQGIDGCDRRLADGAVAVGAGS